METPLAAAWTAPRRPFVDVLWDLHVRKKTGVLEAQHEGTTTIIYFRAGIPVSVGAGFRGNTIGRVLLNLQVINEEQYQEILEIAADCLAGDQPMRFGEVAVAFGFLTPEQINAALAEQVRQRVMHCAQWEAPDCQFSASEQALAGITPYPCAVEHIILEGISRYYDGDRADRLLLECERLYPALTTDPADIACAFSLIAAEQEFLASLDGHLPLDEALCDAAIDVVSAQQLVIALRTMGHIVFREEPWRGKRRPARSFTVQPPVAVAAQDPARQPPASEPPAPALAPAAAAPPPEPAGSPLVAPPPEPARPAPAPAPGVAAPPLEPATPAPPAQPAPPPVTTEPPVSKLRRRPKAQLRPASVAPHGGAPTPRAPARAARSSAPPSTRSRPVASASSGRPADRAAPGPASSAQAGRPSPASDAAAPPPSRTPLAKDTTAPPMSRARQRPAANAGVRDSLMAERTFREGRRCLKAGQLQLAIELLQRAHELEPTTLEYELHWRWAGLASTTDRRAQEQLAGELLTLTRRALREDQGMAFAHYVKGQLAMRKEDHAAAKKAFGNACKLDPSDLDAKRHYLICSRRASG